jgi:transcriptional regulator with PAS, ATPase and Fis domain
VESFRDLSPLEELRKEMHRSFTFEDIVSKNHRIIALFDILPNIAEADSTVLIQGPSGSGKELFAQCVRQRSAVQGHKRTGSEEATQRVALHMWGRVASTCRAILPNR